MNAYDIAVFLSLIDIPYLKERQLIQQLHEDLQVKIPFANFELEIDNCLIGLDPQAMKELQQLQKQQGNLLMPMVVQKDMAHYLKVIKLRLMYTEIEYVKLKLRTLLKQLGYKRRSEKFMREFEHAINDCGLTIFIKGDLVQDRTMIGLDDFMTIRLRSDVEC